LQLYQSIGTGQWFRYFSGAIEVAAAILLLIPRMRTIAIPLAAAALVLGIVKDIFAQGGVPSFPAGLFGAVLIVPNCIQRRDFASPKRMT
jgi:putative oxidoreductase